MKYQIKATSGTSVQTQEVRGIKQLHNTLGALRGRGLKITDISRVMVR